MLTYIGGALFVAWLLLMLFLWTRGGLWKGRKFGNKVAQHLGMSNNFFHSVLENGVKGSSLQLLGILDVTRLTLEQASVQLGPSLNRGLVALEERFGRQEMIENAKPLVAKLVSDWEAFQLQRASQ
jgi:hypothetical protein